MRFDTTRFLDLLTDMLLTQLLPVIAYVAVLAVIAACVALPRCIPRGKRD